MNTARIQHLDALRGIAILLVILFHSYSRWPDFVPYGGSFSSFWLFKYGWLGVELFFLISGFVILMTLEKCSSFLEFFYRRWLRLFPAMLIATLIVYGTSSFFYERPAGIPSLTNVIPGLFFIEPSWISHIINTPISGIEGAFWSLYVEFKFYIIAGFVFFLRRKPTDVIVTCLGLCFLSYTSHFSSKYLTDNATIHFIAKLTSSLSLQFFGWFASGATFYLYHKDKKSNTFTIAILLGFFSAFGLQGFKIDVIISAFLITILFACSLNSLKLQEILNNKILLLVGFLSYPLYLFHENILISSIIKIHHYNSNLPMILLPTIPILALSLIAFFIAHTFEPKLRNAIHSLNRKLTKT